MADKRQRKAMNTREGGSRVVEAKAKAKKKAATKDNTEKEKTDVN